MNVPLPYFFVRENRLPVTLQEELGLLSDKCLLSSFFFAHEIVNGLFFDCLTDSLVLPLRVGILASWRLFQFSDDLFGSLFPHGFPSALLLFYLLSSLEVSVRLRKVSPKFPDTTPYDDYDSLFLYLYFSSSLFWRSSPSTFIYIFFCSPSRVSFYI